MASFVIVSAIFVAGIYFGVLTSKHYKVRIRLMYYTVVEIYLFHYYYIDD